MTERLSSRQRRALSAILPHDGKDRLIDYLEGSGANLHGLTVDEVLRYASELEKIGLLDTEYSDEEKTDVTVTLSSEAASYFDDRRADAVKSAGRYAFQLIVGASGGLVALFVQQALSNQ